MTVWVCVGVIAWARKGVCGWGSLDCCSRERDRERVCVCVCLRACVHGCMFVWVWRCRCDCVGMCEGVVVIALVSRGVRVCLCGTALIDGVHVHVHVCWCGVGG